MLSGNDVLVLAGLFVAYAILVALFLFAVKYRSANRILNTIRRNPDQILREDFRAHCVSVLDDVLRDARATTPHVRRIVAHFEMLPPGEVVPASLPATRLWADGTMIWKDTEHQDVNRISRALDEDQNLKQRLLGSFRPEQFTLISITNRSLTVCHPPTDRVEDIA